MSDKRTLRRVIRDRIAAMPAPTRARADARIAGHLGARVPEGVVLAYAALPDEVDLGPLLTAWAAEGRLALPRMRDRDMTAHLADPRHLVPGPWALCEPPSDAPEVAPEDLAAVVVPGRAFDRAGGRMGRGAGTYDRFLPRAPQATCLGVAYELQLVDLVPTEPHDVPMAWIVTEAGATRATR